MAESSSVSSYFLLRMGEVLDTASTWSKPLVGSGRNSERGLWDDSDASSPSGTLLALDKVRELAS